MKSNISLVLTTILLMFITSTAHAKFVFFDYGGETFMKVADLPDTDVYKINDEYIDIGIRFTENHFFFIPVPTGERHWIGYIPHDDQSYYDWTEEEALAIAASANIKLPPIDQIKLQPIQEYGWILALLAVFFIFVIPYIRRTKSDDD